MIDFCIVLQGRVILEELILSIPLHPSLDALFPCVLPSANSGCSVFWEIHLLKTAILKVIISNISVLKVIYCQSAINDIYFRPLFTQVDNFQSTINTVFQVQFTAECTHVILT